MRSPLTPRPGYVVTVSQLVGGRPVVLSSCNACDWQGRRPTVPLDDDDAAAAVLLDEIHTAVSHVSSHISERVAL